MFRIRHRQQHDAIEPIVIQPHQMDHLRVFHEVARTLTTSLELTQILRAIMEQMAGFFGPERWSLLMIDQEAKDLFYAVVVGDGTESLKGLRVPLGSGVAGMVAATGNPLVVPSVATDPHWSRFARENPHLNIESIACFPIRSGEEALGVIQLFNFKFDLNQEFALSFLRTLCDYAAIAITNARSVDLIHKLTITDDCTGLFNARHLYTLLEEHVTAPGTPFCLLFIDLDRFKQVNDTHGHLVGSRLLAEIGNHIRQTLGPAHPAFRYGGDEFVVLMPGCDKISGAELTWHLRETLRETPFLAGEGLDLHITGSFGLATFPEDGDQVHSILRSADDMMYAVKNTTRDDVAIMGMPRRSGPPRALLGAHSHHEDAEAGTPA